MGEMILLKTKKELDIFMNPTRQEILRELSRCGEPVTPKYLSDRLGISPSSIQFHIRKLEEIGTVILDHTEIIRGIHAKFYTVTDADVSICGWETGHREEREIVMENCFMNTYKGFRKRMRDHEEINLENWMSYGTGTNGVVFLSDEDAKKMFSMIQEFVAAHGKKTPGTSPWEYGLIAYKMDR